MKLDYYESFLEFLKLYQSCYWDEESGPEFLGSGAEGSAYYWKGLVWKIQECNWKNSTFEVCPMGLKSFLWNCQLMEKPHPLFLTPLFMGGFTEEDVQYLVTVKPYVLPAFSFLEFLESEDCYEAWKLIHALQYDEETLKELNDLIGSNFLNWDLHNGNWGFDEELNPKIFDF